MFPLFLLSPNGRKYSMAIKCPASTPVFLSLHTLTQITGRNLKNLYRQFCKIHPFVLIGWCYLQFLLVSGGKLEIPALHRFGQKWQPACAAEEEHCAPAFLRQLGFGTRVDRCQGVASMSFYFWDQIEAGRQAEWMFHFVLLFCKKNIWFSFVGMRLLTSWVLYNSGKQNT